ncbi:MAG: sugar transporter permease [Thermomicrobiales bacterium]|nr:sugar transporter permease [Thermomicrobiales bacterium]MDF3040930.1 sugar transporter permease [Thermomicrobiales bacterium]
MSAGARVDAAAVPEERQGRYWLDRESVLAQVMLLPAVIYIIALVGIPLAMAVMYSLSDVTIGDQSIDFVGLRNFEAALADNTFRMALRNTFAFTIISQIVVLVLANILALVLSADFKGKRLVRFLVLLPWTTPIALGVLGWLWTLDNVYSPIDFVLRRIGVLGVGSPFGPTWYGTNALWLAYPERAQFSVLLVHIWRTLPLAAVILLAGLTAIPQDVKDAANVDGAGFFRQVFYIRIPLLLPIMAVAVLYGIVFTFTDMTVVFILTRGGPVDSTQVLASWAFFRGINGGALSQGAAIALFLFPVLVGVAALMLRLAKRAETV